MTTSAPFSTLLFMECDNFPANEVTVKLTAYFVEAERGDRDEYGAQLEPDHDAYFEIKDIYIEDFHKSVSISEAAVLFEKSEADLYQYFNEQLSEAFFEDDSDMELWF